MGGEGASSSSSWLEGSTGLGDKVLAAGGLEAGAWRGRSAEELLSQPPVHQCVTEQMSDESRR